MIRSATRVEHTPSHLLCRTAALLLTLVAGVPSIVPGKIGQCAENANSPNVILILADDQGYGDLGCHGNPVIKTPNLDRLYRESLRLTNYHVDPTGAPSRAALLTGRYSARTGVWHTMMGRSLLRRGEVTAAEIFARAGYRTAVLGVWNLGDNYPFRPMDRGFQESLVCGGGGITQTPDWWGNTYNAPVLWQNGKPVRTSGYCTDVLFAAATRFVEQSRGKPFFLFLAPNVPHAPYQVSETYSNPYRAAGVPATVADFYGMITNLDENLGQFLAKLSQWGLRENTIVIYTTDNGTAGGGYNAQMRGGAGSPYDGGHRVPCFIRWPAQLRGGHDVKPLTAHFDILPTLIDFCRLPKPLKVTFDGMDLRALLSTEGEAGPHRTLFVQAQNADRPEPWRQSAVMNEQYRLVDGKELYDIRRDPGQTKDLGPENREQVLFLRQAYKKWYEQVSTQFDDCPAIALGSPHANPTTLTCFDWHGPDVPATQRQVAMGLVANGYWAVDVQEAGQYEITLRHRPAWVNAPLPPGMARLKVGDEVQFKPIPPGASGVPFRITLKLGPAQLQTWLIESKGTSRGAYFVDVKLLGPASPAGGKR